MIEKAEDILRSTRYARKTPIAVRFWSKVNIKGADECWIWNGTVKRQSGYGAFQIGKNKQHRAHRIAFLIHNGAIESDLIVMHKCDNPLCVNPNHLQQGTALDNTNDAKLKGRLARGEASKKSFLNPEKVTEIRSMYRPRKVGYEFIGALFGISGTTAMNIIKRNTWRHVA